RSPVKPIDSLPGDGAVGRRQVRLTQNVSASKQGDIGLEKNVWSLWKLTQFRCRGREALGVGGVETKSTFGNFRGREQMIPEAAPAVLSQSVIIGRQRSRHAGSQRTCLAQVRIGLALA